MLPRSFMDYLTAPMPYLVGLPAQMLPMLKGIPMDEVTLVDLDLGKCDPAPGCERDDARMLPWRDELEAALSAVHKNIRSPTEYETSPMIAGRFWRGDRARIGVVAAGLRTHRTLQLTCGPLWLPSSYFRFSAAMWGSCFASNKSCACEKSLLKACVFAQWCLYVCAGVMQEYFCRIFGNYRRFIHADNPVAAAHWSATLGGSLHGLPASQVAAWAQGAMLNTRTHMVWPHVNFWAYACSHLAPLVM